MRLERWASAAALALALAVAPGALRLLPDPAASVERPGLVPLGRVDVSAPAVEEVPITPPGELVGEVAAPAAPAPVFAPAEAPSARGEVYALLIGIDDYPGRSADLGSAVADADTMDAALDGFGVPAGHRVVLRDGQARRADVVAAVQALVTQGGPGATLVLGYAGHVRKLDRDTEALVLADGEMLTDADLAALLAPATTQPMWLVLATCFAGGFTELLAPGRVLTGAADADHLAYENPRLRASYLVHYLIREAWLQGEAGPSVQEAFAYADAELARDHPDRRPVQVDLSDRPLVLGPGDPVTNGPSGSGGGASDSDPPPSPPPTSGPPTKEPRDDEDCLLGLLC